MTREDLHRLCRVEGIGIMCDAFDIILDRGEVSLEQIEAFLNEDRNTFTCYENFVARGINLLSDAIQADISATAEGAQERPEFPVATKVFELGYPETIGVVTGHARDGWTYVKWPLQELAHPPGQLRSAE